MCLIILEDVNSDFSDPPQQFGLLDVGALKNNWRVQAKIWETMFKSYTTTKNVFLLSVQKYLI